MGWIYEIKRDGFRLIARSDGKRVRLSARKGNDFTGRFQFIATVVVELPARSCVIDGEAMACDENGLAVFELIRRRRTSADAVHYAFDLLELDGEDPWRPIEHRRARLAELLATAPSAVVFKEAFEADRLQARLRARL